jgi:polyisoprenoid-binding protein YceI
MLIRALLCLLILAPVEAMALPVAYALDPVSSSVTFEVPFGPDRISGTFPIVSATVSLDFDRPSNSRIGAVLDASGATASFPFATQAMRGPKVLDSARFPNIAFTSTSMDFHQTQAEVRGLMTIRGVERPEILHAELFRQQGTAAGDRDHLSVVLTGSIPRSDYGAVGWADMVGDQIDIRILVRINRAN